MEENPSAVRVEVFNIKVRPGELWSADEVHGDVDSDHEGELWSAEDQGEVDSDDEDGDSQQFRESRLKMKKTRRDGAQLEPKIQELPENAGFIRKFEDWFRNKSFLAFNNSRFKNYSLACHLAPSASGFKELRDPSMMGEWVHSVGGPKGKSDPSRRKEMLKSNAPLRDFVGEELSKVEDDFSTESIYKKEMLQRNLKQISEKINSKKLFQQLTKLEDQAKVNLSTNFNEKEAVTKWFTF